MSELTAASPDLAPAPAPLPHGSVAAPPSACAEGLDVALNRSGAPDPLGSPLEEALRYASHGLPVFPCKPDKKPATSNGFKDATTDEAQIRQWWARMPDALIGMPTGEASCISVLDLDMCKETGEPLGEPNALKMHLLFNDAPGVRTPSGGRHVYFKHVDGVRNSAKKLGPGIDVRGEGGYVCVPGAGGYQRIGPPAWVPTGVCEISPHLNAALGLGAPILQEARAAPAPQLDIAGDAWAQQALQEEVANVSDAPEGQRNDTLNKAAFALGQIVGGGGLERNAVEAALLGAALHCGLGEEEARKTIHSGLSTGALQPRAPSGGVTAPSPASGMAGNRSVVFSVNPLPPAPPAPLMRHEGTAEPFPIEALGPLRAAAEAAQHISQAPMALAAQSALAVASLATQALADVETLSGQATPLSIFALSVAKSGERKSSVDRLLMEPVREVEKALSKEHQEETASWRNKQDIWVAQRNDILKKAKNGGDEAAVDLDALGPEPAGPLMPQLVASEPTFEGITKHLGISRPSLGIFSDEGGGFIGGHAMSTDNKLKTMAGLSGMWDGAPVNRTRAGDGVSTFYGRRLCCHLMVQPVAAEGFLSDPIVMGQGFLARFLVVQPESAIGTRLRHGHDPASKAKLSVWSGRVRELLTAQMPLSEGARNELDPPMLALSAEAREILQYFADAVESAQIKGGDLEAIQPFASKAAEHAARIAGVMTIFADGNACEVSADAMEDAVKLATFYIREALRITNAAVISQEARQGEALRVWLNEKWAEPCISAVEVAQSGPGSMRETAKARRTLQYLEGFGHLIPVHGGAEVKGNRRREAWSVVRGGVA